MTRSLKPRVTFKETQSGDVAMGTEDAEGLVRVFGAREQGVTLLLLKQLLDGACTVRDGMPDENAANALLAQIEGIGPKDEIEAMLANQLVTTNALIAQQARLTRRSESVVQLEANGTLLTKLQRTYLAQVDALQRYRGKAGRQNIIVKHVTVNEGGQAIVGAVQTRGGQHVEDEDQPHAQAQAALAYAPEPPLRSPCADDREFVPIAGDAERAVPNARRLVTRCADGEQECPEARPLRRRTSRDA